MSVSVFPAPAAGGGGSLADDALRFLLTEPTTEQLNEFFQSEVSAVGFVTAVAGPHLSGMELKPAVLSAVAASTSAMNAVAASEAARAAVLASNTAIDLINASNIAIGKLSAGIAGLNPSDFADMNAVAASETAMNAVAASAAAMNAVVASETAMNAVAASETAMNAVAASETATNAITLQNLPFSFSNAQAVFNPGVGFIRINRLEQQTVAGNFIGLASTINLTGKNTLRVPASANTLGQAGSRMRAVVRINGSEVLVLSGVETTVENRDINISSFNGPCSIEFGYSSTSLGSSDGYFVQYGPWFVF